jgi:plasmid replication initiation protein
MVAAITPRAEMRGAQTLRTMAAAENGGAVGRQVIQIVPSDPPLRDLRDVMQWPCLLALEKRRIRPIVIDSGAVHIGVHAPADIGIATIWDWDVIIALASVLRDAMQAGARVSPRVSILPSHLLRVMERGTSGRDYAALLATVRRLRMTTVLTTIRSADGAGRERPFSWLSDYCIPTRDGGVVTTQGRDCHADGTRPWTLELPPWLYSAIMRDEAPPILAIHPGYWSLTGGLERALYRLARQSDPGRSNGCRVWTWTMQTLVNRLGVSRSVATIARQIRAIATADRIPEYRLEVRAATRGGAEAVIMSRVSDKPPRPRRGVWHPRMLEATE